MLFLRWRAPKDTLESESQDATAPLHAEDRDEGADAEEVVSEKGQTEEKENLLVLALKRSGTIDEGTAELLDDVLAVELAKYKNQFNAMTGADVKRILELEAAKTTIDCDDSGCMSEIAEALGARYVINGRVGELGTQKVMTLTLFDAQKNEALERIQVQDNKLEGLSAQMRASVAKLVSPIAGTPLALEPSSSSSLSPLLWNASAIALGVTLAGGGLAFDVLSPTSSNGEFDLFDLLGPGLYLVAAPAVVVGGILLNPPWVTNNAYFPSLHLSPSLRVRTLRCLPTQRGQGWRSL